MKKKLMDNCKKYEFVGVICEDGHEHTIKAFGEICGTPFDNFEDELENQLAYVEKISKGYDVEILTANTVEEAVEKDIIFDTEDEDENIRYQIK